MKQGFMRGMTLHRTTLRVLLKAMSEAGGGTVVLSSSNGKTLYWSFQDEVSDHDSPPVVYDKPPRKKKVKQVEPWYVKKTKPRRR